MKQKIKTGAVTFIAIMLLIIAPVVTMDTTYASDTLTTNTTSKDVKQSKNIQNKTDINIKKQTIISKLLSLGSEYTLKTNLEDDFTMRSSKKTFDVWARKGGLKMPAFATLFRLNSAGKEKYIGEINVAWDDGNKSSFTLDMSNQAKGDFVIKVWTGGDSIESASVVKAYHFTYEKTPKGGYIGDIVIDIEAFTISLGYVEEPERLPIYEGDNSATVIDRYLKSKGYTYDSTGSIESGFYLGRIRGLTSIDLSTAKLEQTVATVVDEDEWNKDDYEEGSLGEKDFTANSGWMYSVNNVFPNVGFSEFYFEPEEKPIFGSYLGERGNLIGFLLISAQMKLIQNIYDAEHKSITQISGLKFQVKDDSIKENVVKEGKTILLPERGFIKFIGDNSFVFINYDL